MQTSEPDYITINQPIKFYEEGAQYFQQASSIQPGEVMMAWNEWISSWAIRFFFKQFSMYKLVLHFEFYLLLQ